MAFQKSDRQITALVPAFNEGDRIEKVLTPLVQSGIFQEIIVVDDGSTDDTEQRVRAYPVKYIKLPVNQGKGKAMEVGVKHAANDIIFFCDADIEGFTPGRYHLIIDPVVQGEVEMCIGMLSRRSYSFRSVLAFIPLIGGQRALTKELWQKLPDYYKQKFRIEAGLNFYAKYYGKGFRFKVIRGLKHTNKEQKYGFTTGFVSRMKMVLDYIQAFLKLQFTDIPKTLLNRRLFLTNFFITFLSWLLGIFLFVATMYGPRQFIYDLFAKKMASGEDTPILKFFLFLFSIMSIELLFFVSALIVLMNGLILLINLKKFIFFVRGYYERYHISVLSPEQIHQKNIQGDKRGE